MLNSKQTARQAFSSLLTAWDTGQDPLPETIQEVRLAHSLLTRGEPTAEELRPFLGERWVICRRAGRSQESSDINVVTERDYLVAQIRALAARLDLPEGFVAARVQPISRHSRTIATPNFSRLV